MSLDRIDEMFSDAEKTETVDVPEALGLVSSTLAKAATDDGLTDDEVRGLFARAYHITKALSDWAESDAEYETVDVPAGLLEQARSDAPGAASMPVSKSMDAIKGRLSGDVSDRESTAKADDVAWGHDLNADNEDDRVDWGPDPAGL